jgi:hypothetical protein
MIALTATIVAIYWKGRRCDPLSQSGQLGTSSAPDLPYGDVVTE